MRTAVHAPPQPLQRALRYPPLTPFREAPTCVFPVSLPRPSAKTPGLYGSVETLSEGGSTVQVDEEYLQQSIVNPGFQIVQGFPAGVMPDYSGLPSADV